MEAKFGIKRLKNSEEAATSAEATLRIDKLGSPPKYYQNLGKKDDFGRFEYPLKKENMKNDRNELRKNSNGTKVREGVSIKGKEALSKMERNYKNTRISKRREGDKTAIEISEEATRKSK